MELENEIEMETNSVLWIQRKWNMMKNVPTDLVAELKYLKIVKYSLTATKFSVCIFLITKGDQMYVLGDNWCRVITRDEDSYPYVIESPLHRSDLSDLGIMDIQVGSTSVIARTIDGAVYTWGWNQVGQLGAGHDDDIEGPYLVGALKPYKACKVCCRNETVLCLTECGKLFGWGRNILDMSGCGWQQAKFDATPKLLLEDVKCKVVDVDIFTLSGIVALMEDGRVYSWGVSRFGMLGNSSSCDLHDPGLVLVPENVTIQKISCGAGHCLALSSDGRVYSWGANGCGQVGNGSTLTVTTPTLVSYGEEAVVDIAASPTNAICRSLLKTSSGKVYCWGHINGVNVTKPTLTKYRSFNEAFTIWNVRSEYQIE